MEVGRVWRSCVLCVSPPPYSVGPALPHAPIPTPSPPTQTQNREWRILSSVRHPHICGLVDRTRYENPRVRCTKLVMEIMDTSLQVRF